MTPFEFFEKGGVVMYPLLLISLASIAVTVERAIAYKSLGDTAPDLVSEAVKMIRSGRHAEALRLAESRKGPVADTVATIIKSKNDPSSLVEGRIEETVGEYSLRLEKFLPVLDTSATLSPLLGLLGTIIGMVGVFQRFQAAGGDEGAKQQVLAAVGEALYATASGIFIACICFASYNYFTARQRTIVGETEQAATRVFNAMAESAHSGATPAGAVR